MKDFRAFPQIAAVILAAGYSSRMGRFKPLLPLAGKRAIEWAVSAFRDAGIGTIRVVTGHHADELEPVLHGLGVVAKRNERYAEGMYTSVQTGIASLPSSVRACFVLPVDIPLLRPATIVALAESHGAYPAPVLYPRFREVRGHPPLIDRMLFEAIRAGNGEGGLGALLARHAQAAVEIDVADEGTLLDMDTPVDYAALQGLAIERHLPTIAECEAILEARGVNERIRRHSRAVAKVAEAIADSLAARGAPIDMHLVTAASLLHDIAKGRHAHAAVGADIVDGLGFPEVADAIRTHMDLEYEQGPADEAAIVFLADKLVREEQRVSLEARFRPALLRYADQPDALHGATHKYDVARAVLSAIEEQARKSMTDILADCAVPA